MNDEKDDRILQYDQEKQAIKEIIALFDVSSSYRTEIEEVERVYQRRQSCNDNDEFVEIEIECVEHSSHHSCESTSKFVELHAEKRTSRMRWVVEWDRHHQTDEAIARD